MMAENHKVTPKQTWSQCLGHHIKEYAVDFTQVGRNDRQQLSIFSELNLPLFVPIVHINTDWAPISLSLSTPLSKEADLLQE